MVKLFKNICACLLLAIFMSSISYAGTQKLAYITNEEDSDIIDLLVITDKHNDAVKMKMVYKYSNGKVFKSDEYSVRQVSQGIVLLNKKGRDIVKLGSRNFSTHQGGDVKLDYLVSGISGRRGSLFLDLARNGDDWALSVNRSKIKKMHFISNKKAFIGTIGIKKIVTK